MFLLLIALYTGEMITENYNTAQECEEALFKAIDEGKRKGIADIRCVDISNHY